MAHRNWNPECKIYIGGLKDDANRYDIEDTFGRFGPVRDVWVARKPPGFAFVEMEDPRDVQDAVKELDGTKICGARCRVELSNGGGGRDGGGRGRDGGRGGGRRGRSPSRSRSRSRDRRRRSPSYRSMSPKRSTSRSRDVRRSRDNSRGRGRGGSRSRSRS